MNLEALARRATFAAALADVLPAGARAEAGALFGVEPAFTFGEATVLLVASAAAAAVVREAPALLEPPDVVTPWARARLWTARHEGAPVGAVVSLPFLRALVAETDAAGLALVDVDPDPPRSVLVDGSLARALVFVPRARAPRRPKLRLDRVQDAWVRANGRGLAPDAPRTIEEHALAALARSPGEPMRVKELLREARASVKASADDGKRLAAALVRAWSRSDVELELRGR